MSYRKLKECGYEEPYSFLFKWKLKQHQYLWMKRKLKQEKKFLDTLFQTVDSNVSLDETQRKIILCEEDHQFIIAGAGSGKTTTLVAKIMYMIKRCNISEDDILVITYTNQAVSELKKRLQAEFKVMVKVVTIHKFCYDIIKEYDQDYYVCEETSEVFLESIFEWKQKYPEEYQTMYELYYEKFIVSPHHPNSFLMFCQKFIFLFLELGNEETLFDKWIKDYSENTRLVLLLKSMKKIYQLYVDILKRNDLITFPQMIQNACVILMNKVRNFPQNYIFVDEFQDISYSRYQLLQILVQFFHIHLICVGDDFQSIYSFAGSNIDIFLKHQKSFSGMKMSFITTTYRNSNELITIAGNFIMKNSSQIKKKLCSNKTEKYPIILWEYQDNLKQIMYEIFDMIKKDTNKKEILLLGRYHFDINLLLEEKIIEKKDDIYFNASYPNLKFQFYTVHQSKGLGFDEVILLNGSRGRYGFPSEVSLDEIDILLKKSTIQNQLEEERRLFYVALTRTKNKVHIIYPKYRASMFVKEIMKESNVLTKK